MNEKYVTITGFKNYYGSRPFAVGTVLRCEKCPENEFDAEAIRCVLPVVGTVGYVANSPDTVAGGTMSAGRIYDKVSSAFYVRVMFVTRTKIICRVFDDPADAEAELLNQEKELRGEEPADGGRDFTELDF